MNDCRNRTPALVFAAEAGWLGAVEDGMHSAEGGLRNSGTGGIVADMLLGAAAGAVGVWALDRVDWFMFRHEDPQARRRTQAVRPGGMDPAHVAANKIAKATTGNGLSPRQPHPAGLAVHYAIGIAPAALYGALRERVPAVRTGRGLLYGLGLFLIQDELLNAVTGLSADPRSYPWQPHARGLVAHLVYGAVTDATLDLLHRGRRPVH